MLRWRRALPGLLVLSKPGTATWSWSCRITQSIQQSFLLALLYEVWHSTKKMAQTDDTWSALSNCCELRIRRLSLYQSNDLFIWLWLFWTNAKNRLTSFHYITDLDKDWVDLLALLPIHVLGGTSHHLSSLSRRWYEGVPAKVWYCDSLPQWFYLFILMWRKSLLLCSCTILSIHSNQRNWEQVPVPCQRCMCLSPASGHTPLVTKAG